MKRSYIVGLVIVVVAIAGYLVYKQRHTASTSSSNTSTTSPGTTSTSSSSTSTTTTPQSAATITYDSSGFHPASTTVKSGDTVTFTNNSSGEIQVDSNPHPVHTDDTDLNVGGIAAGQSKSVTLTKKGTFSFHNHLNPSDTASITIQ